MTGLLFSTTGFTAGFKVGNFPIINFGFGAAMATGAGGGGVANAGRCLSFGGPLVTRGGKTGSSSSRPWMMSSDKGMEI